jgi:L-rhamnose isomerase
MTHLPRIATHLGPFGSGGDRYNLKGYKAAVSIEERLRQAAAVDGLGAVELNFRGLVNEHSAVATMALMDSLGLVCANISMNVWGDAAWGLGGLTNPQASTRQEAVSLVVSGMQTARSIGCGLVSLWPGQDGFDYPFETDYRAMVDRFVGGVRECAESVPEVRICIEYKVKEPRTHCLVDTAARTMWLIGKIDRPNVGVLLDVGHSLLAGENVAMSAALLQREGLLDLLHFNDNYGEWDWDMIPATIRFWELIELVFWLKETGYEGWNSIDISAPRSDAAQAVQHSVTNIQRLYRLVEKLDRDLLLANLDHAEPGANMKLLSDQVFKALGG